MLRRASYHVVAKVVRIETNTNDDSLFLVFEVLDEKFKQEIKKDWTQDIELELINKQLIKFEEE